MDKAGQEFWNSLWRSSETPPAVDPTDDTLRNWVNQQFHQLFVQLFDKSCTPDMALLEVGCGKSAWLPYFAKEFSFKISGLDYSPIGCEMARIVLRASNVDGEIVQADLFSPPSYLEGAFDVVVSFGLVEHFDDTSNCVSALAWFVKPGGIVITSIPNMVGWNGVLQKTLNRPVYDIHQLIDRRLLKDAHARAGLDVLECDYSLFTNFGVVNLAGVSPRTPLGFMKKAFIAILARLSMAIWLVEKTTVLFPVNRLTSPYINCLARKPDQRVHSQKSHE